MTHLTRVLIVATTIAAASALALPAAAQAEIYPPSGSCSVSPTATTPGTTVTFGCVAETFSGNETVTITITGENGSAAEIGVIHLAISTASGLATSEPDGSLADLPITLPADATGTYNIAAVSPTSAGGTAAVTVSSGTGDLPTTGLDAASLTGVWIAGGVLVAAGVTLAVIALVRRSRNP